MQDYLDYLTHEVKKSPNTINGYQYDIAQFRRFIGDRDWFTVDDDTASQYLQALNKAGLKVNTVLRRIAAVKSMYRYYKRKGKVTNNPFDSLDLPKRPGRLPHYIQPDEFESLLAFPDDSELGKRDRAILALLFEAGVRVGELTHMNVDDVDLDAHEAFVVEHEGRAGKGDAERIVIFGDTAERHLREYFKVRPLLAVNRQQEQALFISYRGKRLPPNGVQYIVRNASMKALGREITPHWLRHSFASHLVNNDVEMDTVAELMGHKDTKITRQFYAHIQTSKLHRAYEQATPRGKKLRLISSDKQDIHDKVLEL